MIPVLLLLAFSAPPGRADDETLRLDRARVLASPGVPKLGIERILRSREPIGWPLPAGRIVVLGLPGVDDRADELARLWQLLPAGDDLHGGYVRHAWSDGGRSVLAVFAADGVAMRMGTRIAPLLTAGGKRHRPPFRLRTLDWPGTNWTEGVRLAARHAANRYWIRPLDHDSESLSRLLHLLERLGIEPIIEVQYSEEDGDAVVPWNLERLLESHPIRHVSFVSVIAQRRSLTRLRILLATLRGRTQIGEIYGDHETLGDADAIGISSRSSHPLGARVTRKDLRSAARRAGQRLLYEELWCADLDTPLPTRPRGRDPDLGAEAEGIVIRGGPAAGPVLAHAWDPESRDAQDALPRLLTVLPHGMDDAAAFRQEAAARLDGAAEYVRWAGSLAELLRVDHVRENEWLVPHVPAAIETDGHLDEPAWAHARTVSLPSHQGTLLLLADGRRLHIAVIATAGEKSARVAGWSAAQAVRRLGSPVEQRRTREDGRLVLEARLGRFDLGGDAHPGRVLHLDVTVGGVLSQHTLVLGP